MQFQRVNENLESHCRNDAKERGDDGNSVLPGGSVLELGIGARAITRGLGNDVVVRGGGDHGDAAAGKGRGAGVGGCASAGGLLVGRGSRFYFAMLVEMFKLFAKYSDCSDEWD